MYKNPAILGLIVLIVIPIFIIFLIKDTSMSAQMQSTVFLSSILFLSCISGIIYSLKNKTLLTRDFMFKYSFLSMMIVQIIAVLIVPILALFSHNGFGATLVYVIIIGFVPFIMLSIALYIYGIVATILFFLANYFSLLIINKISK